MCVCVCVYRRRVPKDLPHGVGEYLVLDEFSEDDEVWLVWTDKTNERQEKSIRQLAQEARQGNAHDENVLTYYRWAARTHTHTTHTPKAHTHTHLHSFLIVVCVCLSVCTHT